VIGPFRCGTYWFRSPESGRHATGVVLSRAGGDAPRFGVWVAESVAGSCAGVVVPAGVGRGVRGAGWCAVVSLSGRWGVSVFFGVEMAVVRGVLVGWGRVVVVPGGCLCWWVGGSAPGEGVGKLPRFPGGSPASSPHPAHRFGGEWCRGG
jgi:hypothetical protein